MSVVKSKEEVDKLRKCGDLVARCLQMLKKRAMPGVSGLYLDMLAEEYIRDNKAEPAFKGYRGFPASICFSRNHVLVHGIPRKDDVIQDGDIITIDCGVQLNGSYGDAARCFGVGEITEENKSLLYHTDKVLEAGIEKCRAGNHMGDVSYAIQKYTRKNKYYVVQQFCGHAIGTQMHEEPAVPNYGEPGAGILLEPGMVFCVEPMLVKTQTRLGVLSDGWTIQTLDGSVCTHIEEMVLITDGDPEVISTITD